MQKSILLPLFLIISLPVLAEFDPGRSGFSVIINNEVYPYRAFATFVLPGERLIIRINDQGDSNITASTGQGVLDQTAPRRWVWNAPAEPGMHELSFLREADGEAVNLNVFVMVPSNLLVDGALNGFQIGDYPSQPGDDPLYAHPDGFIEVTEETLSIPVSPHFVLGQFINLNGNQFPQYLVLRERLILKLEALLERINDRGISAESFGILTGYLTPTVNAATGRDQYSRHIYGGAAVLIVDSNPEDNMMDDLNNDNAVNDRDGRLIFDIADELYQEPDKSYLRGGLFLYVGLQKHGPAIMVDARGFRKRWDDDQDLFADPARVRSNLESTPAKLPEDFNSEVE